MYRPTFAVDAIGRDEPKALEIGLEAMGYLLEALVKIDRAHLRRFPNTPRLYKSGVRYDTMDPPEGSACGDDDWSDVVRILETKGANGNPIADCFPIGTLLLKNDFSLVPIEDIRVGDIIWGRDAWTTIEHVTYKGLLSVDAMTMNNGSVVQLTGDHHIYVGRCEEHKGLDSSGYGCSCRIEDRIVERIPLRSLKEKDVLITPNRLPFGDNEPDADKAYVEGLYVSDGWCSDNHRFCISGLDGAPKEAQKKEVQSICERLGIGTYWHRKYIAVHDVDWSLRMQEMGTHAPNKRLLSINLGEGAAASTLRGLMADSNINSGGNANGGWTFTTTSKTLAVQMRILQKMFCKSTSYRYYTAEQHRGLGKNAIHVIGIRDPKGKREKLLRVKSVDRNIAEVPCYDIQTSDHYVYLPEHDVTVSNCEDLACWRAAELQEFFGIHAKPHVFLRRDWIKDEDGKRRRRHLYHIVVQWPEGLRRYPKTVKRMNGLLIEDPSRVLGM